MNPGFGGSDDSRNSDTADPERCVVGRRGEGGATERLSTHW